VEASRLLRSDSRLIRLLYLATTRLQYWLPSKESDPVAKAHAPHSAQMYLLDDNARTLFPLSSSALMAQWL
jgi:hypothetical protein